MPLIIGVIIFLLSLTGIALSYIYIDHFTQRLNIFLNPNLGDTYQIDTAYNAIINGGWFGVGPGEGTIKNILPDAHTDFIFAVAGEEFGVFIALAVIGLFGFLVLRGCLRIMSESSLFVFLAVAGLLIQFGLQALIHISSSLQLIPAKGMTLPFISYGGSSFLALSIGMGMVLALTRKRPGREEFL